MKRTIHCMVGLVVSMLLSGEAFAGEPGTWIGTWATSPTGLPTVKKMGSFDVPDPTTLKGTIRYRLRISQGGSQIRIRLSNEYASERLVVAAVSVGIAGDGLGAVPGSLRKATFAGKDAVTIPMGAPVLTDPIELSVQSLTDLLVSVYVPEGVTVINWPMRDSRYAGFSANTNATLMERLPDSKAMGIRPIVSAVNVLSDRPRKVVAAFGDSITDGAIDPASGERGWPGALSRILREKDISVVNAGIGGNRVLQSTRFLGNAALARLDQDVFSVPGLTHIVMLEGINDIGMSGEGGMFGDTPLVTAADLIAGYSQIVARAHERGVKVFGATILPFEGAGYYSAEKEKIRAAVNTWIRTSKTFDGVVDLDMAMRDPEHPGRLRAEYDPGDHLHPNPAGYRRMGEVIGSLFR